MSQMSRITDALVRIGEEIKSVRGVATSKYTKPGGGIPLSDLDASTRSLTSRWEQEVLVQSGVRMLGNGAAPLGIHVPYAVTLKGVKYQFETGTTSGTTSGTLMLDGVSVGASAAMNIAANGLVQHITGLNIAVPAGSRLAFFLTAMGSGTGKGIYMSLWGEYT